MRSVVSDNKPVALWAVPRSISTAFERVFVERDDFEVLHEPFSAYYYGEDRLSDRYADVEPQAENNYERVLANILEPRESRVFVKDMAYHAKGVISSGFSVSRVCGEGRDARLTRRDRASFREGSADHGEERGDVAGSARAIRAS